MANPSLLRLSLARREALEALDGGAVIVVDRSNCAWLGTSMLAPQTRYFLTSHRLVEKALRSSAITSQGNGYVISDRGRAVLALQASARSSASAGPVTRSQPPSDAQLAYAKSLGIDVPWNATMAEVSDLIRSRQADDPRALPSTRAFAHMVGLSFTQYTGERLLHDGISDHVRLPRRQVALAHWFSCCVAQDLAHAVGVTVNVDDPALDKVAHLLAEDDEALRSIRTYGNHDLFVLRTPPDAEQPRTRRRDTIAYRKVDSLLQRYRMADQLDG